MKVDEDVYPWVAVLAELPTYLQLTAASLAAEKLTQLQHMLLAGFRFSVNLMLPVGFGFSANLMLPIGSRFS